MPREFCAKMVSQNSSFLIKFLFFRVEPRRVRHLTFRPRTARVVVTKNRTAQDRVGNVTRFSTSSAPATTARVERLLSVAGFILSNRRMRTTDENFELQLFSKVSRDLIPTVIKNGVYTS